MSFHVFGCSHEKKMYVSLIDQMYCVVRDEVILNCTLVDVTVLNCTKKVFFFSVPRGFFSKYGAAQGYSS